MQINSCQQLSNKKDIYITIICINIYITFEIDIERAFMNPNMSHAKAKKN